VKRSIITHISQAYSHHHSKLPADIVINCTGFSSFFLGGVEDSTLKPVRGQTVLVRNESDIMVGTTGTDDKDELTYIMARASGGGTILGGCTQLGNWESQPDLNLANRIMKRVVDLHPEFANGKGVEGLSVIRNAVGLRPWRQEGVRLESEMVANELGEKKWCVHNYGHAGYGYQVSYACATDVVKLVKDIVDTK
jgi:D-amino-acid oxidase